MTNGPFKKISQTLRSVFKSPNKNDNMSEQNASESPKKATPKTPLPPLFGKHFKTTKNARKLMDPQGRVCELDINDPHRVLVYVTPEVRAMRLQQDMAHNKEGLDEMLWSQPLLYEISQKEPTLRITRKKVDGSVLEIFQRDLFNEAEQEEYKDKPNMGSSLAAFPLGFKQSHMYGHVYILSRTRRPVQEQEVASGIGANDDGAMQIGKDGEGAGLDSEH